MKRRAKTMMLSSSRQTLQYCFSFDDFINVQSIIAIGSCWLTFEEIESETKRPIELPLVAGFLSALLHFMRHGRMIHCYIFFCLTLCIAVTENNCHLQRNSIGIRAMIHR